MEHGDCIKETKRILGQYSKMKVAVQNLAEETEARAAALQGESVAIACYGDEPTGGTAELTATEAAARRMRVAADIEEMQERKREMERTLRAVDRALACLSADDERLVRGRYIDGCTWRRVAYDVGYAETWVDKRGRKALQDIAMMLFGACLKPLQTRLVF